MNNLYLIINAGSSSLKFSLYEMPENNEIVSGYVEKIGQLESFYTLKFNGNKKEVSKVIMNHDEAVNVMLEELLANQFITSISDIKGVGHRVLHGGEIYSESVLITDEVVKNIESLTNLGPLHHPGQLAGINAMRKKLGDVIQVAVFDTAFHQTIPEVNYMYATPYEWYTNYGVRKYGFHGTSHKYITEYMQNWYEREDVNLIICHIGSGASISCIKNGQCFNTTMGLTPLDGLIMGTRSGNIDPSIIEYICKMENKTVAEVTNELNKKSGLLGISGKNDFRDVDALANAGNKKAILARNMFKKSIVNYISQYYFELQGKVDAIVFTAGVGENAQNLREEIIMDIKDVMNIEFDALENQKIGRGKEKTTGLISSNSSLIDCLVVPTNEEYMILKDTYEISQLMDKNDEYKRVLSR